MYTIKKVVLQPFTCWDFFKTFLRVTLEVRFTSLTKECSRRSLSLPSITPSAVPICHCHCHFSCDCDCQVGVTSFGSVFGCEVNMHAGFTRCQYGSVDDDDDVYDMSGHGTSCTKRQSSFRDDICHKHHKQRLCKIIITRVKVHFVNVV